MWEKQPLVIDPTVVVNFLLDHVNWMILRVNDAITFIDYGGCKKETDRQKIICFDDVDQLSGMTLTSRSGC